ncbi:hypothetical protein HanXRQr2_Chr05g0220601 [Helianthus annuus]|uniref:Uncharacterized protein n=1 Tax=Helianthus annuus TaxID=4232 RepID=A0A9K3J0M8_HELAN|nr:hypothetical protein HanXRQr2_Chr05g0220601 [Helianthus annuus]
MKHGVWRVKGIIQGFFFMGDFGNLDIGFIDIGSVFEFDKIKF